MATTHHYGITLVEQAQAQKEVTVNAALARIDKLLKTQSSGGALVDWRVNPTAVTDSGGEAAAILAAMEAGGDAPDIRVPPAATRTLTFDIPAMAQPGMVTFALDGDSDIDYTISYEESFDNGANYSTPAGLTVIQPTTLSLFRRQKFEIGAGIARRVRLSFAHDRTASATDVGYRIIRGCKFVEYDADDLHDYVVVVGASIVEENVRARDWEGWFAEYFSRDAVIFNEAVTGWNVGNFAAGIAAIVARHPRARAVLLHIGGNDVTDNRPFAEAAQADLDDFYNDMVAGLNVIVNAGIQPVLSRLTYRNYTASPAVGGLSNEENGALPFNRAIHDRLIARYCPQASNGERGIVDPYTYLSQNVFLIDLSIDAAGVHPRGYGGFRLSKYWALAFGSALFHGREYTQANESAVTGVDGAKEDVIISFGDVGAAGLWHPIEVGRVDSPEGMSYNRISGNGTGAKTPLINTSGEKCPVGIDITTAFTTLNQSGYASATDTLYVARAKLGNAVVDNVTTAVILVTGLNDSATYRLTFLGSRNGVPSRLTRITIGASSDTFDAANNDSDTVVISGVSPSSGSITVNVAADSVSGASFGYLAVMQVTRE